MFFLTALERQEFKEPQIWGARSLAASQEFTGSIVQTLTATNIDSNRSCVFAWCWAGRANSWAATAPPFILKPPSPRPLSALHLQYCSVHVGGPHTSKGPEWEPLHWVTSSHSPAEQDRTCQCRANTCWRRSVRDFWSERHTFLHLLEQVP